MRIDIFLLAIQLQTYNSTEPLMFQQNAPLDQSNMSKMTCTIPISPEYSTMMTGSLLHSMFTVPVLKVCHRKRLNNKTCAISNDFKAL